jgi:hypothetical protein
VFHVAVTADCTDRFVLVIRVQFFLCRAGNEVDCVNEAVRIDDSRVKQVLNYGALSVKFRRVSVYFITYYKYTHYFFCNWVDRKSENLNVDSLIS